MANTSNTSSSDINRPFGHALPNIGIKLTNTNYLLWKTRFTPFLRAYRMLDLVEGLSVCPSTTDSSTTTSPSDATSPIDIQNWVERDQLALGWILSTIDDFVTTQLIGCTASHAAWRTLEKNYAQQKQARALQLRVEFQNLAKGTTTMTEYLNKAKLIADHLATVGRPFSTDEILSRVLHGLGSDYAGFRTALNLSGVTHTLDSLHGPLLNQEASFLLDATTTTDLVAASPMAHFASQSSRQSLSSSA